MNKVDYKKVEVLNGEFGLCEICDNYTPRVLVVDVAYLDDGQVCCQYCWNAYGEMN
jgi:hypothetical protein